MDLLSVKQCLPSDADAIRGVRLRMLRQAPEAYDADLSSAEAQPQWHWALWATGSEDLPRATWLAVADGQPVGMVWQRRFGPTTAKSAPSGSTATGAGAG